MAVGQYSITIVGCGPGSIDCMTGEAVRAVESADVLVGANRLLEMFAQISVERVAVGADIEGALNEIEARYQEQRVVVLVTGDPGICSLARPVIRRFGRGKCRVIPGISSVQTAFARVGVDWYGAAIISLHGRDSEMSAEQLSLCDKIAILTEGSKSMPQIAEIAGSMNEYQVFVCEDLTLESEQVRQVDVNELAGLEISSRTIVLLIKEQLLR